MKAVRQRLPLFTLASGHSPHLNLFRYEGHQPGPTVHIQAALHASEVQGAAVVHQLAQFLTELDAVDLHGSLVLLPLANPFALDIKVGEHTPGPFSLEDGFNWNRRFRRLVGDSDMADTGLLDADHWLAECSDSDDHTLIAAYRAALREAFAGLAGNAVPMSQRLADVLLGHLLSCDLVLDLHTSTDGTDFVYVPGSCDAAQMGGLLGVPFGLRMGAGFGAALDEAFNHAWLPLLPHLANARSLPRAFTLEYGGQERVDLFAAKRQAEALVNFLRWMGVLRDQSWVESSPAYVVDDAAYASVPAPCGGLCSWSVEAGTSVVAGQLLAQVLAFDGHSAAGKLLDVLAPWDGVVLNRYPSAVVHEGAPLVKMIPSKCLNAEAKRS